MYARIYLWLEKIPFELRVYLRDGGGGGRGWLKGAFCCCCFFLRRGKEMMLVLEQAAEARCINYRMFRYCFAHYEDS